MSLENELMEKINEIAVKYKLHEEKYLKNIDYYRNLLIKTRLEIRIFENTNLLEIGSVVIAVIALVIAAVLFNNEFGGSVVFVEETNGKFVKQSYGNILKLLSYSMLGLVLGAIFYLIYILLAHLKRVKKYSQYLLLEECLVMYLNIKNQKPNKESSKVMN